MNEEEFTEFRWTTVTMWWCAAVLVVGCVICMLDAGAHDGWWLIPLGLLCFLIGHGFFSLRTRGYTRRESSHIALNRAESYLVLTGSALAVSPLLVAMVRVCIWSSG